jgi:hypothetical protein
LNLINQLKEKNITPTIGIMAMLKIGSGTYNDYKKRTPLRKSGIKEEKIEPAETVVVNALKEKETATATLPVGNKVVAITNPKATENAKKQQLKRAYETFGRGNVIDTLDVCEGTVLKKQKITTSKGTTIIRDVCVDDR